MGTAHGRVTEKSPEYYYGIWFRHILSARNAGFNRNIDVVAELGPGDAIGVGLCALLSGANHYIALDLVPHAYAQKNIDIFESLIHLFRSRESVSSKFRPSRQQEEGGDFPPDLISREDHDRNLHPERLEAIRAALRGDTANNSVKVEYVAPWDNLALIEQGTVDFLLSNAVMEHIDDLSFAYDACDHWLAEGGCMSHQIDFRCHGTANRWNGHWTYSPRQWEKIRGDNPYLLNREPYSTHRSLVENRKFQIISEHLARDTNVVKRKALAPEFQALSQDDFVTMGARIQAIKV